MPCNFISITPKQICRRQICFPYYSEKSQLPTIFHHLERWVQRYIIVKSRKKWKEDCKSFLPYQSSLGNSFHKSVAKNRTFLLMITQGKREASSVIIDIPLNWNEMKLMKTNVPAIFQLSQSFYSRKFKTIPCGLQQLLPQKSHPVWKSGTVGNESTAFECLSQDNKFLSTHYSMADGCRWM